MSVATALRRPLRAFAVIGGLIAVGSPDVASAVDDCGAIADRLERAQDIPPGLLQAVALAESGGGHPAPGNGRAWPWTIRSGAESFYLPSKDLALRKVRELRAAGRSNIDVGCMQINLGYHDTAFASLDEAFDPVSNVAYGARYLSELQRETRSWAKATGRYHSGDPERGEAYRSRVWRLWRDLCRRQGREAPMITEAMFVGDRLARLVGGGVTDDAGESRPGARIIMPGSGQRSARRAGALSILRGR